MVRSEFFPQLKDAFYQMISNHILANNFISKLEKETDVLLFGGSVRDYFDNSFKITPRDIDLVVSSADQGVLEDIISEYNIHYRKNKFDGYKLVFEDGLIIDIWDIEKTWAFNKNKVLFKSTEDLNKTVFLNIDAIFYSLTTRRLYDAGYSKAKKEGELDIVLKDNPFPMLNILRALIYKNKYGLDFSKNLLVYFSTWILNQNDINSTLDQMEEIKQKRYGYQCNVALLDEVNLIMKGIRNEIQLPLSIT